MPLSRTGQLAYLHGMDLNALSPEDRRSWQLNAAAIAHACSSWSTAKIVVTRNLDRMDREKRVGPAYLARCRDLVQQGPEVMKAAFLDVSDEGQLLRSIHPWAGLLPNTERFAILRETRRQPEDESC
jgi:hypothetical protein